VCCDCQVAVVAEKYSNTRGGGGGVGGVEM
jgi:hypothetical protein